MTNLHDLLTEDAIRLDVEASTWQEAIGAAGALLEATGVADGRYTQAMIDSVVEHGPYIVLTPGFASGSTPAATCRGSWPSSRSSWSPRSPRCCCRASTPGSSTRASSGVTPA